MKYEEIKIGDVFTYQDDKETVISKSDEYKIITTIDDDMIPTPWKKEDLHRLKPTKEELLNKVTEVVNEFGNHIIEQTKSGVIILTPINK